MPNRNGQPKRHSLRKAIDAKCRDCTYDLKAAGNWRVQTSLCSATECPLWPFRPTASVIPASTLSYYQVPDGDPVKTDLLARGVQVREDAGREPAFRTLEVPM